MRAGISMRLPFPRTDVLSEVEVYENLSDDETVPEKLIRYKILDDEGNLDEFKEFLKKFE